MNFLVLENAGQKRASASEPGDSFRNTGCYELPFQENLQKVAEKEVREEIHWECREIIL